MVDAKAARLDADAMEGAFSSRFAHSDEPSGEYEGYNFTLSGGPICTQFSTLQSHDDDPGMEPGDSKGGVSFCTEQNVLRWVPETSEWEWGPAALTPVRNP
jgi:hypothetical protein